MKTHAKLMINGKQLGLISFEVDLELNTYGRATFKVREEVVGHGLARFYLGDKNGLVPVFLGATSAIQTTAPGESTIICKELTSVLEMDTKLSLRHLTAKDLLEEIEQSTGLKFKVPSEAAYLDRRIPNFLNVATAKGAIDRFKIWGIKRGVWFQLPSGEVYWGSWDECPYAKRSPLPFDSRAISSKNARDFGFSIPTVPALRPGMKIDSAKIIKALSIKGDQTRVRWCEL